VIAPSRSAAYRRFYLYSALSVAVIAISIAAAILLRLALQPFGVGPRPSADDTSRTISLGIALLAIAVPVGVAHLWLIVRSFADPAERAAEVRHQYLNLWLAVALLVILFVGQSAVTAIAQGDVQDVTIQASIFVVAAIVGEIAAWWISRTPPASPTPRIRVAVVVMLVAMATAAVAVATAASGAGGLFQTSGARREQEQLVRSGLVTAGLALTVWSVGFAWQRRWPEARDRLAYALAGYGVGTLVLLVSAALGIAAAIRYARDGAQIGPFVTTWPPIAAGALLVLVHARLLLHDRGRNGHPAVTTTRLLLAFPALVGLGLIVGGLGLGWQAILERDTVPSQHLSDDLMQAGSLLLVGALAYLPSWRALAARSAADSAVRRFYLFTVVCLALVGGLVSGVIVLYNAITSAAHVGDADAARTALTWLVPAVALAAIFAAHLRLLLRDQRQTRVAEAAAPADPLVALLEDVRAGRVSVEDAAAKLRVPGP
jgi:hypothetical protein